MIEDNKGIENKFRKLEDFELLETAIDSYILEIESLAETLPLVISLIAMKQRDETNKMKKFIKSNTKENDTGEKQFKIPINQFNQFNRLDTDCNIASAAMNILPRTFVVALVSQYDAYLGNLYRALFNIKPQLAYSLEKEFSFQEILKYKDIDKLIYEVIEKDIENLLRASHFEQLKVLERKISKSIGKEFTLTTNLPILSTFIEVAERRNLFVHCNGLVSQQYIENCKKHKVINIENVNISDELIVDPIYFENAYKSYLEIGVKLNQVLWRKFLPSRLIEADKNLNNIAYDLLYNGYYDMAQILLNFATEEISKYGNQEMRKIFVINKALAFYLSNDKITANNIIDAEDFSIGNEFKLAVCVLKENFEEAKKIMIKIGPKDELIGQEEYQEWPLFKVFRETDIFKETFRILFKEDFIIREAPKKAFHSFLETIRSKKKD